MVRATLTATEDGHGNLIQQLKKEASAEGRRMSDHDKGIEDPVGQGHRHLQHEGSHGRSSTTRAGLEPQSTRPISNW